MSEPMATPLDVRLMNISTAMLLLVLAGMVLSALFHWMVQHPVTAIRGVTVLGDVTHNNAVTLRANVVPHIRGTFLTVDLGAVRQAFENVPWVRKAVVRKDFPNRLKVILEEHQAVAYWGHESDSRLLNSHGEVFEANAGDLEQDDLPHLSGPQGQSTQVLAMYQVLDPMFVALDLRIERLELNGRGGWRTLLDSGAVLELGSGSEIEVAARVQRFLATLKQATQRYGRGVSAMESADLRHQEGYALRLRGVSTVVPGSKE